jgi:glucose/arabinose dehydrogenase
VTQRLWDTENGPDRMDEINLVDPGSNSGWRILMGPESQDPEGEDHTDLVDLLPDSTYSDPEFSFLEPIGITALAFLAGSALGSEYDDGLLVGDFSSGDLYLFRLNGARDGFTFSGPLADLVADGVLERLPLRFASGFEITTDIQTGPDGAIYVVSLGSGIFRIAPVPEPGTGALLAFGLLALARSRRTAAAARPRSALRRAPGPAAVAARRELGPFEARA